MNASVFLSLCAVLAVAGCSRQEPPPPNVTTNSASSNPLSTPADYLGAVAKAKRVSEKVIDTTSLNQSIQLFYAQEDRFPKDLDELVSKHYLPGIPAAPSGTRWAYHPQTGEIKAVRQP